MKQNSLQTPLKHRNSPRRTPNPTLNMQRRTSQKESIPPFFLTLITQLLQIPHFTNGRAPMHQQPLMQTPTVCEFRRPRLKRNIVAYNGREMAIVQPADGALRSLQANGYAVVARARLALRGVGVAVSRDVSVWLILVVSSDGWGGRGKDVLMPPHIARANHHNIALSELRPLPLQRLLNLLNRNLMAGHCTRRWALVLFVPS